MKIQDMAYSRKDIFEKVTNLAPRFVEHFDKIWQYPQSMARNHWASEMQAWLNKVLSYRVKESNKPLSLQQKMDWFFTNGSESETLFNDRAEAMVYDDFIDLVAVNNDVKKSLNDVGLL